MQRLKTEPRKNFKEILEAEGMIFHTAGNKPYWHETAYYKFTAAQVDELEAASNELWRLFLEAGEYLVNNEHRLLQMGIPAWVIPLIKQTWENEPPALYARFDLAYDGKNPPKLLELNGDTPTMLMECARNQWYWKQRKFSAADQFNSIYEHLVAKFKDIKGCFEGNVLHFCHSFHPENAEDLMTVAFLQECAADAGLETAAMAMEQIGFDHVRQILVDPEGRQIRQIFKLYPWEWLVHEDAADGQDILAKTFDTVLWIEPIWKMMFSNKGILPILWELFPNHPNLVPAYFDGPRDMMEWVKKPMMSREGANVTVQSNDGNVEIDGDYGEEGYVWQQYIKLPVFDGFHPIIGSWMVDGESCGIGIREAEGLVTDNGSIFTPHIFLP